ncbi:hypothetical protein B0J18DRAFT_424990 [Chaetomium sp. MPI-SDFR-AT-0129]|nr:hypothetical protein B0J18DRAFT_424990 [Chaetomium sp. MPI-SDFR-AT-0129]
MASTQDRGRSPIREMNDIDDDDLTVYSDSDSVSDISTSSYHYFPMRDTQDHAPVFRLKRGEQNRPAYEAWSIYYYPKTREQIEGHKVLGIRAVSLVDEIPSRVELRRKPSTQSELSDAHLQAIEKFQATHKRSWATRPFLGAGKTYEHDLDERCRKAPGEVRTTLNDLLFDRGRSTSTRYRTRTWTVVSFREQLQDRFAQTDFTDVKRHKLRFWKNPKPRDHLLYTVVIRGAETNVVPPGEDGFNSFSPTANPWVQSDNLESDRRERARREQRNALRQKRRSFRPPYRARSFSPVMHTRTRSLAHRTRTRSFSPPSYRSWRSSRYDSPSPSPSIRIRSRNDSPPPYRRSPRPTSLIRIRSRSPSSRSPSVRIRVLPRQSPSFIRDESYPRRPREPPIPPFRPFDSTLPRPTEEYRPLPHNCDACRDPRVRPCVHYPAHLPCRRPIMFSPTGPYHLACLTCPMNDPYGFTPHVEPEPRNPHSDVWPAPFYQHPPPPPQPYFGHPPPFPAASFPPIPGPCPPAPPIRPMSWMSGYSGSQQSSIGPMPPAPNPFSPLSTPPLTSAGGSSAGGSSPSLSAASRVRTPVLVGVVEGSETAVEVVDDAERRRVRAGSPGISVVGSE